MNDVTQAPGDEENAIESAEATNSVQAQGDPAGAEVEAALPIYIRPVRNRRVDADSSSVQGLDAAQSTIGDAKKNGPEMLRGLPYGSESDSAKAATNEPVTTPLSDTGKSSPFLGVHADRKVASVREEGLEFGAAATAAAAADIGDLPATAPAADLPRVRLRKRWIALCFGLTFLIYVAFVPLFLNYSSPPTGDQPFYLMDTISIVQDGDLNVRNNYNNRDEDKFYTLAPHPNGFVGMIAPYPLPPQVGPTTARPSTEWYGAHLPGLAIALVPAWIIGSWFSLWWPATIIFMCFVGAMVAVNVFLLAHELTGKLWIAFAVWIPIAFSNPIMTYSYLLFTELATGLLVIYAYRRLALGWGANGPIRLALVGLCIGYIPWLAWRAAPISILLGLYALVQWLRYWRSTRPVGSRFKVQGSKYPTSSRVYSLSAIPINVQSTEVTVGSPKPRRVSPWFKDIGFGEQETAVESVNLASEHVRPELDSQNNSAIRLPDTKISIGRLLLLAVWMLIPLVISGVFLAIYNRWLYGSLVPVSIADPSYAFQWPWTGQDNLIKFSNAVVGLLYDQQSGLLPYAPIYLLAGVGAIALFRSVRRSDRGLLVWLGIITLPYMGIVAGFTGWNGVWCPPARYLTTFAPLMAAPLAMSLYSLTRTRLQRAIYVPLYTLLAIPGILLMAVAIHNARLMWPNPSGAVFNWLATDPTSPFKVDLLKWLPANTFPDEVREPQLSAWAIGISLGIIFLGYALMLQRRTVVTDDGRRAAIQKAEGRTYDSAIRTPRRWPLLAHAVVWLGAGALIAYVWFMANYKFLEHKTLLTQVQVFGVAPPVKSGEGMTYSGNKLYITDYVGKTVGTLDLSSGAYSLIQPTLPDGRTISFTDPGDLKVGPDGLLYVLNNGPDDQALLVMQPDGHIVRQFALNGKTPIAIGLVFAPNGDGVYVSDMTGSKIIKYGPGFGDPLEWYGGASGAFNNVAGIAVDKDGTIYAAESSSPTRIQQLDASGKFVRDFPLDCSARFVAISGDWLDVGCSTIMMSINKVSGQKQVVHFTEQSIQPASPTSLAYAPDGTLYVLDGDKVIAYTVQH